MEVVIGGLISSVITAGVTIVIAGTGELLGERAGLLNLGIEGIMSVGAVSAFVIVNTVAPNAWLGLLGAAIVGLIFGIIYGLTSVYLKANQVLIGLALALIGDGLARHIGRPYGGTPSLASFSTYRLPILGNIPILGNALFNQDLFVYFAYFILPFVAAYIIYRTKHGLSLRAVGQNPAAADASGVNVYAIRFLYACVAGTLFGIAGAYLPLALINTWQDGAVAGRGFIALTLVFFAGWNPLFLVLGGLLFGAATSIGFILQVQGWGIDPYFLGMTPYVVTILFVVIAAYIRNRRHPGSSGLGPAALTLPYHRE